MQNSRASFRGCIPCLLSLILTGLFAGCSASTNGPEVTYERATLLQARGQYEDAILAFSDAATKMPDFPDLYFNRGICYESLQLNEKALADYSRCLDLLPEFADAANNRGVVLAKLQRFEEAADQFSLLLEQMPDNVLALRNRGLCFHDLGQFEKALADYNRGVALAADDIETLFQRANLHLDQNSLSLAESDFTAVINLAPDHAKAWMNRGVARYQLGQRESALEDLEKAHELDDNIVIPDLKWLEEGRGSVTAAKPVFAGPAVWHEALQFAMNEAQARGYTNLEIVESFPNHACARLTAEKESATVTLVTALASTDKAENVQVPALTESDATSRFVLIVIASSDGSDKGSAGIRLLRFDEQWTPTADSLTPVINRLKL